MDRGEIQTTTAGHASAGLEHHGGAAELGDFLLFGLGFRGVAGYQTLVLDITVSLAFVWALAWVGWYTYGRDFLSFSLDIVAQVLLKTTHGDHCVVTQCLYDLQGRHEAIFIDLLQHSIELIACLF